MNTPFGERPWWWWINPWLSLWRREGAYEQALDIIEELAKAKEDRS